MVKEDDGAGGPAGVAGPRFFGCAIRRFVSLSALGPVGDGYRADFVRRHVELVSCLINSRNQRLTYDLRFVARPDPRGLPHGRVEVAIVGRLENAGEAEMADAGRQLVGLMGAYYDELDLAPLEGSDLERFLRPFQPRAVAVIGRRQEWEPLDSIGGPLVNERHLGFVQAPPSPPGDGARLLLVYPFVPAYAPYTPVFRLLLAQPSPSCLSIRLRPTALRSEEREFLQGQIAECEKYAQLGVGGASGDVSGLRPTLQRQARLYQERQLRVLHGLEDDAALVTVELLSPGPIARALVEAVGHALTQAAGTATGEGDLSRYLCGGYEAAKPADPAAHLDALGNVELVLPPQPGLPDTAQRLRYLFDAWEAAAAFRLPHATADVLPGVAVRRYRLQPAPESAVESGVQLGVTSGGMVAEPVRLGDEDRLRHVYLVGQTGTGKTTMLQSMLLDDIRAGKGVCLIDPHGDLFRNVLARIPDDRVDDVVVLDPADTEFPVGLNLLECADPAQQHFVVQELVGIITRLMLDEYGSDAPKMIGPIFFQHMRMGLLLVMSDPDTPGTLADLYRLFNAKDYWKRWMPLRSDDANLTRWVEEVLPQTDYTHPTSDGPSMGGYVGSKFEEFVFDPMLRNIFGQRRSTIDFRAIMDGGKILLVNLAKGLLTEATSRFLGMIVLGKLQVAAMSRARAASDERRPFYVYVDEFQSIATQNFISMLSEGRKFGLGLVLANQFVSQLEDKRIVQSIFGNVGTLVCFRLGQGDAQLLARYFAPAFSESDLGLLPNWQAIASVPSAGEVAPPFNLSTVPPEHVASETTVARARQRSRERYARPVATVAAEATERAPRDPSGRSD